MKSNYSAQAKEKLNQMKMESASEVGVSLKQGYNGDLTSKQAGSIGGQMVKNICPQQTLKYKRKMQTAFGHSCSITYNANICI